MADGSVTGRNLSKAAKEGTKAVAEVAVAALSGEVKRLQAQPSVSVESLFETGFEGRGGRIVEATPPAWIEFHDQLATGRVVAIDAEGIFSTPPKMVQIATADLILIELPEARGSLSPELEALLWDESVTKVFCDSTSQDKTCLGLPTSAKEGPNVIELENLTDEHYGPGGAPRGLVKCLLIATGRRVTKDKGGWEWFETCGRLERLEDVPKREQRYAAMDAWFTLLAYNGIVQPDKDKKTAPDKRDKQEKVADKGAKDTVRKKHKKGGKATPAEAAPFAPPLPKPRIK